MKKREYGARGEVAKKKVFIFFFGIDYLFCFKYDVIEVMLANAN